MADNMIILNSIDKYNNDLKLETKHPLVSVIDMNKADQSFFSEDITLSYGVYALFLKTTYCGEVVYGRQPYDYQAGTVTSFAPGQTVHLKGNPDYKSTSIGVIFHPDLIHGTSLGQNIKQYTFFNYSSREALHLKEDERDLFCDCLSKIEQELERPIDAHSKKLLCRYIELLLDYCMRFYERQFVTRKVANKDVLDKFEEQLNLYFQSEALTLQGIPSVKYFAERCFLSANYFGDLVKKETGYTPQEHIQFKLIELAKDELLNTNKSISEISDRLGFQYIQHFNRYFKRSVGMSPSQYRKEAV